ncbi:MAG: sodium:calcium antiporter [Candidatus Bathyarchaeota archaeon]|nr:sodium:calcium antiporter [Candidatus Bathyarchaeota archaeon]
MFEEWGLLGNALILLASLLVLDRASDLAVDNAVKVADVTGLGKSTVGFVLIALVTTLPELSVSVFAAISGEGERIGVAVGNVLGSNIVNICLILGIGFLIASLKSADRLKFVPLVTEEGVGTLYFGLFIASIIPLSLVYIGYASRFIGVLLIAIFIFNIFQLSRTKRLKNESSLGEHARLKRYAFFALLGVSVVVTCAYFIVDSATYIALWFGIPHVVIGATIVAFGTSLPELANTIKASSKGHLSLALGNIVGSCFTNTTLILGAALVGSSLAVNMAAFTNLVVFSIITNVLLWYFLTSERIGWREGVMLVFMYLVFLFASFGGYRT